MSNTDNNDDRIYRAAQELKKLRLKHTRSSAEALKSISSFPRTHTIVHALKSNLAEKSKEDSLASEKIKELDETISRLHIERGEIESRLDEAIRKGGELQQLADEYVRSIDGLQKRERLRHLIDRVDSRAKKHLLEGGSLSKRFASEESVDAYVMSIDLRRSTELMLKAREPILFAEFLHELAACLRETVVGHGGVFDKFTGDGVLAFFPEFYSGPDSGLLAVSAAAQAHIAFSELYRSSRNKFDTVLLDVGLGVGIDWGKVSLVSLESELTVVGRPVVFACRLGGAPANVTLVNQPAYERLLSGHSEYLEFEESSVEVKHEGSTLAYSIKRNDKQFNRQPPEWLNEDIAPDIENSDNADKATPSENHGVCEVQTP